MKQWLVFAVGATIPAAQAQPNPVIQTETRVVLVDAIVTAKHGAYIHDLTEKDFHVFQDGKEQAIRSFSLETAAKAAEPRSLLLFFDKTSMEARDQVVAKEAASRFIDAETGPNRRMAVAAYDGELRILQTFTDNAGRLKDALPAVSSSFTPAETAASGRRTADSGSSAAADLGARNMIRALGGLGRSLGALPGRKIVVLFAGGLRSSADQRAAVKDAIEQCNRSGVAIYAVDTRPVFVQTDQGPMPAALPADRHPRGRGGAQLSGDAEDVAAAQQSGADSQQMASALALGTGGFLIRNASDLLTGLQTIAAEQDEYYVLTFSPPESKEGACHTLRVKVDRSGTIVRARTGYCTSKPQDLLAGTAAAKSLEKRAAEAAGGNLAASLALAFFYVSPNVARVHAALEIPAGALRFENQKGKRHAEIDLLGIAAAMDGSVEARFSDAVKLDFENQAQIDNLKDHPVHYEKEFKIAPGHYTFTLALGQGETNFGKVEAPLVIEPWAGEFALSSLVLSKQTQLSAGLGLSLAEDRTPLVADGFQLIPSGSHQFRSSEPGFVYFEIYGPDADSAHVQMRVLDPKSGEAKWDSGILRLPTSENGAKAAMIPAGAPLPLSKLAPGSYTLEVSAEIGGMTRKRTIDFDVRE
jgi:VWFA-related protein